MSLPQSPKSTTHTPSPHTNTIGSITQDFSTIDLQTKEIERILLRYNQQTKILFKRYSDFSMKRRQDDFNFNENNNENKNKFVDDDYAVNWSTVEKAIFTARGVQVMKP